jgi:hypothetical protein
VLEDAIELPSLEAAQREKMQAYRVELLMALGRYTGAVTAINASSFGDPDAPDRLMTGTRARLPDCSLGRKRVRVRRSRSR